MTVKKLKQIIQNAAYFDDDEKKELIGLFNIMNLDQANELAKIILWAEVQKNNLEFEKKLLIKAIAEIFNQMNTVAVKEANKNARESLEEEESKNNKIKMKNLLKDLNDV